jgi:transposase
LTLEPQRERRKQVVRLHRKGCGVMQIVELRGLSYPTVRAAIDRYEKGGLAAIKPATRGKRAGQGRTLAEEQEQASPELNPEERLNADLKQAIGTKVPVRTKAKLKLAATEHMFKLEQAPERINSFFQDPRVKYAA